MSPNLFLLARKACSPHKWFEHKEVSQSLDFQEIWSSPVPGIYHHSLSRGWHLVAVKESSEFVELETPLKVIYAKCLHRYLFEEDYLDRKRSGFRKDLPRQKEPQTFFRMDDGITWVQCYDENDEFIPGPYQRFVYNERKDQFRPMMRKDDPHLDPVRSGSHSSSAVSSLHTSSGDNSAAISRKTSFERQRGSIRNTPAGSIHMQPHAHGNSKSSRTSFEHPNAAS